MRINARNPEFPYKAIWASERMGAKEGMNWLVCGQPAAKTLLLTLSGIRPRCLHPQRNMGRGLARGPSLAEVAGGITLLKWS